MTWLEAPSPKVQEIEDKVIKRTLQSITRLGYETVAIVTRVRGPRFSESIVQG